jgi:hypothetical protein
MGSQPITLHQPFRVGDLICHCRAPVMWCEDDITVSNPLRTPSVPPLQLAQKRAQKHTKRHVWRPGRPGAGAVPTLCADK